MIPPYGFDSFLSDKRAGRDMVGGFGPVDCVTG